MRVVGGELGGRRLASPPRGAEVRPTTDRVREALFSVLGDVSEARVLDLFAGTGALSIEALSRGAASAVMVDGDVALARRNVDALDLADRVEVARADAMRYLAKRGECFDLIFLDPPYRLADRLAPELDKQLPTRLAQGGRVVVETAVRTPLALALPKAFERAYGETLIRIHTT